jgi:hypothetical protein
VGYTSLNSNEGDMVPGYIPYSQEVFTGGIITGDVLWMIPPKDGDHLVMYDRFIDFDKSTYMALY